MRFILKVILIFLLPFGFSQATETVFWKNKKKLYKKIKEDRYIVVSARLVKENQQDKLRLVSAGHIKAPIEYTWKKILEFDSYSKISSHFKRLEYDKNRERLYVKISAYGFEANMWMKLAKEETKSTKTLIYKVVQGSFTGLAGQIQLDMVAPGVTEISSQGKLIAKEIPLPAILASVGMEVAGRQMAAKMRSYVESSFRGVKE